MDNLPGLRSKPSALWIHILVWLAFFMIPLLFFESAAGRERFMIMGWFIQLLMLFYFYYNFSYLIPRFLLQKRIGLYVFLLFLGLIVVSILNILFVLGTSGIIERHHPFNLWRTATFPVYPAIMAFALSSAVRIIMEYFQNERQKKEMESEKLAAELAFLKSQVNPHFLFNILNNICSLARKKSDSTENAIIKLSQIMRYMLQDSKDETVGLEKEVEYLQNYIELQRLRISGKVKIIFTVEGQPEHFSVAPLLLIPFVENAFKHGVSYQDEAEIIINLSALGNTLVFTVENKIFGNREEFSDQGSGIGLKNVIRRLDLLYPGKHELTILDKNNCYKIDLVIYF
ncbi:MAG: histidine kinase [Bacteroidales bacterium]|jgi:sensor histidine kinase YesM|nr:histidine kinase [Bacteroidales bacterium]